MARRRKKFSFILLKKITHRLTSFVWKGLPFCVASFLVVFLFFGVRQMLHADPYFQIEKITVFPAGILNQSELNFLEAQAKGKSLVEINLKELSQILERNPKIERAEVTRILPKELNVYLIRRLPIFQVQLQSNGPYFLVSKDQVISAIQKQPRPDLLLLEDYSSGKKRYSIGMLYQNAHFKSIREVFLTLRNEAVFRNENMIRTAVDDMGNVSIFFKDGLELKVGKRFDLSSASQIVLRSLLKSKERANYLYLDLRYHDIIIRKKSD